MGPGVRIGPVMRKSGPGFSRGRVPKSMFDSSRGLLNFCAILTCRYSVAWRLEATDELPLLVVVLDPPLETDTMSESGT